MTEKEVRKPKQTRSIEKKQQLKSVALKLFSHNGFHQTTTNEIAKEAGISIGTLYSYFKDKTAIYEELVKDIYEDALTQIPNFDPETIKNPVELVRMYIEIVMKIHSYEPEFQKEISSLSIHDESFHKLEEKYRNDAFSKILFLLKRYEFMLKITDLKTASLILQNSLEAVVHEVQLYENDYDKEKVISELTMLFSNYLFKDEYLV